MRLNAFFGGTSELIPARTAESDDKQEFTSAQDIVLSGSPAVSRSSGDQERPCSSNQSSPSKLLKTDFQRNFQPFFTKPHVSLASWNQLLGTRDLSSVCKNIDDVYQNPAPVNCEDSSLNATHLRKLFVSNLSAKTVRRKCNKTLPTVKEIMPSAQGSAQSVIDLTTPDDASSTRDLSLELDSIPIKALQFFEDVRPAYRGTFTKQPPSRSGLRLGKNPFEQSLPDTNYQYDSEGEWENPEDGEDLDSEGDEDACSEEDGDEMEGFVDDGEVDCKALELSNKRRMVVGDLVPYCSGLRWEDINGKSLAPKGVDGKNDLVFEHFRMEILSGALRAVDGNADSLLMKDLQIPSIFRLSHSEQSIVVYLHRQTRCPQS